MRGWQDFRAWLTSADLWSGVFERLLVVGLFGVLGLLWRKLRAWWRASSNVGTSVSSSEQEARLGGEKIKFEHEVERYVIDELTLLASDGRLPPGGPLPEVRCRAVTARAFEFRELQLEEEPDRDPAKARSEVSACARQAVKEEVASQWADHLRTTSPDEWIDLLRRQGPAN